MGYEEQVRWCERCHCSVPVDEWKVSLGASGLRHVGPMRDHDAACFVEPDENGNTACGFVERIPVPA